MKKTDSFIKERLLWKVKQNKVLNQNSFCFKDLNKIEKLEYINEIAPYQIGNPILLFIGINKSWTIFGTKKVISKTSTSIDFVEYSNLDKYTVGDDPMGIFTTVNNKHEFAKTEQHKILIKEKSGRILSLCGPKGAETYQMLSILLMMDRLQNK